MRKLIVSIALLGALVIPSAASASAHDQAVAVAAQSAAGIEQFGGHTVTFKVDRCVRLSRNLTTCVYGLIATATRSDTLNGSCLSRVIVRRHSARSASLYCTRLFQ